MLGVAVKLPMYYNRQGRIPSQWQFATVFHLGVERLGVAVKCYNRQVRIPSQWQSATVFHLGVERLGVAVKLPM